MLLRREVRCRYHVDVMQHLLIRTDAGQPCRGRYLSIELLVLVLSARQEHTWTSLRRLRNAVSREMHVTQAGIGLHVARPFAPGQAPAEA